MRIYIYLIFSLSFFGCATQKHKDISYLGSNTINESPKLNIFLPKRSNTDQLPVLIFVHGGNWNTGNKDQYGFFGKNFAKKDVITVIPDYTLSPKANYDVQAQEIAAVIKWTLANITNYNGNPRQIFISGHSAGGHLAALAVMNPKYGINPSDISGIILIDAAGLDMKHYLLENPPTDAHDYKATWTTDPIKWQDASPIYFLNEQTPPLLIYVGNKTYKSIKVTNERFVSALRSFDPNAKLIPINKSHIPMILQYYFSGSERFKETKAFMSTAIKAK